MSLANKNSVHVDPATTNMSVGAVADVKQKAMTQVMVAEQTQREAQTDVAKSSSVEGSVYGAVITEMVVPGLSSLTALGILDARTDDKLGLSSNNSDDFIQDAAKPNAFFAPTQEEASAFDIFSANTRRVPLKVFDGGKSTAMDVFEKASVASTSLKDNDPVNVKSWGEPKDVLSPALAQVKQAFALSLKAQLANETALNSTLVVEKQHAAMMYQANQFAPGLGSKMANGPTIRPEILLSEAKSIQDSAA